MLARFLGTAAFLSSLLACSADQQQPSPIPGASNSKNGVGVRHHHRIKHATLSYATKLRHIVVVVMENRSLNDLFHGFPNAQTQDWGLDVNGDHVTLTAEPLATNWDPVHSHLPQNGAQYGGFATEYDNGKNDGWSNETFICDTGSCPGETAYAYVRKSDIQQYWDLATNFTLADEMYQTNEGPSYVSHQYLVAAQAYGYSSGTGQDAAENPYADYQCSMNNTSDVYTVNLKTQSYPGTEKSGTEIAPCQDYNTIFDLVDIAAGGGYPTINWKSYVPVTNVHFWNAPMSVKHLYSLYKKEGGDSGTGNFIVDPSLANFASDVSTGNLPALSYVIPCPQWSDHPGTSNGSYGPSFVSFIANTIGLSKRYWTTEPTAIVVVWDDWGGWFDGMTPYHDPNPLGNSLDPNNYGYRTPMLVISPYSLAGMVDSKGMTQAAILTFIEAAFDLGSLGYTDGIAYSGDNMISGNVFNFNQAPLKYTKEPLQSGAPNFGSSSLKCPDPDFDG